MDDEVLARSEKTTTAENNRRSVRNRWIAAAACFCLIAGFGAWSLFGGRTAPADPNGAGSHTPVQMQKVQADPAVYGGSDLRAALQAENEIYIIDWTSETGADGAINWYIMVGEPQDDWELVGTIRSAAESRWDLAENLQANREEFLGCRLYRDPDLPGELWMEHAGRYEHYLAQKYLCSWIRYDGRLWLYEGDCEICGLGDLRSSTVFFPEDSKELGMLCYHPDKRLPDNELEITQNAELDQHRIYYSESQDCLLVEIPNGASGGRTAYWRFYPVSPDAFGKKPVK
ncbi:MAG: hypothetical protein IKQ54_02240 [Oscillospiraceae bacterium]|nr:hypothetical protein [Oscillospiraceae bacterium]